MSKEETDLLIKMVMERMTQLDEKLEGIRETVNKMRLALVAAVAALFGSGAINIFEILTK